MRRHEYQGQGLLHCQHCGHTFGAAVHHRAMAGTLPGDPPRTRQEVALR